MRLWHKDLIDVLPRQQLLGQWRELCAIMRNIEAKGTPGHILVNRVMDYPISHLFWYATDVVTEMRMRGYNPNPDNFCKSCEAVSKETPWPAFVDTKDLFPGWHNARYLFQCYYNLQEKYDCGGISEEEWRRIIVKVIEMTGRSKDD